MEYKIMNKRNRKIIIDILLTAALLLLMPYEMVGEAAHEWIGAGMFVALILHHILNRKWTGRIGKGNYTPVRILQTVLVFLLVICILGSMASGILLSGHLFDFINIRGISAAAQRIHMTCAYWGFVLMALHLGIHWQIFLGAAGDIFSKPKGILQRRIRTWTARAACVAIVLYGTYAFVKRDIASYLFLQVHFVFFDYSEPVAFYLIDYAAAMGMLIFIGYYLNKALQSIYRKVRTK